MKHAVMPLADLEPGQMRAVTVGGLPLVLIRQPNGTVTAMRDRCPHFGAPLSNGRLQPLANGYRHGERELSETEYVVRCPWHNYEFRADTGLCAADPKKRVLMYTVDVEDDMIYVSR